VKEKWQLGYLDLIVTMHNISIIQSTLTSRVPLRHLILTDLVGIWKLKKIVSASEVKLETK